MSPSPKKINRAYVNYLLRKLEEAPSNRRLMVTEPGVGYRLKARASPTLEVGL